jgi:hypothetical protein
LGRKTKSLKLIEGSENQLNVILSDLKNSAEVVVKLALFFSCNQVGLLVAKIKTDDRVVDSLNPYSTGSWVAGIKPKIFYKIIR